MSDYTRQYQMYFEHPYKVGNIDLIFEMGWLSYAHEDSRADEDYINLDVAADNVWISFNKPESSVCVRWEGNTSPESIKALAIKLWDNYQSSIKASEGVEIGIFQDAVGKRHALPVDTYQVFRQSQFWQGCKHITTATRTGLDSRQVKALQDISGKVAKVGVFDLVGNGWTLQGDVALTDSQAVKREIELEKQGKRLKSWERSMKRMDMMPSAAGAILGKMSEEV
jgi:hypothetical protein